MNFSLRFCSLGVNPIPFCAYWANKRAKHLLAVEFTIQADTEWL